MPYYDHFLSYRQEPVSPGTMNAFAIDTGRGLMYVVGSFGLYEPDTSHGVAAWDGYHWRALGSALNGSLFAAVIHKGDLYVGGTFTIGGTEDETLTLARWDGKQWHPVRTHFSGSIRTLLSFDGNLYAGGEFISVQDTTLHNFARWNGKEWFADGGTFNGAVLCLCVHDNAVYAGGAFDRVRSAPTGYIARWTHNTWESVVSPFSTPVHTLLSFEGQLYAGAEFLTTHREPTTGVAVFTEHIWRDLSEDYRTLYQPKQSMSTVSLAVVPAGLYQGHDSFVLAALTVDNVSYLAPLTHWFAMIPGDYFSYEPHEFIITTAVFKDCLHIGGQNISALLWSDFIVEEIFVVSVSNDSSPTNLTALVTPTKEGLILRLAAPENGIAECTIYDLSGRVVEHWTLKVQAGIQTIEHILQTPVHGRYFLTLHYHDTVQTVGFITD